MNNRVSRKPDPHVRVEDLLPVSRHGVPGEVSVGCYTAEGRRSGRPLVEGLQSILSQSNLLCFPSVDGGDTV